MSVDMRLDLHVHSRHSPDSHLTLEEIAYQLPYAGMRGFALTDHNSVVGHREIPNLRARNRGLIVLPGVEVSAQEGHVLAYGVTELPPVHRPVDETCEWVRDHGGEVVLAHPFRIVHGVGRRVADSVRVAGIETINGHSSVVANFKAEVIAARRVLARTGGSDVHQLHDIGRASTEFPSDATTVDDLLEAIRRRKVRPAGQSLRWAERFRLGIRTGALRIARGFRAI